MAGGGALTHVVFDNIDFDNEYSLFYNTNSWGGTYTEISPSNLPSEFSYLFLKIKKKSGLNVSNLFYATINLSGLPLIANINQLYTADTDNKNDMFYWQIMSGDVETTVTFHKSEGLNSSIGNIPMGELTFNGVQSVTYNGTDYTKLVVDGTNYPQVIMISFTIDGTSYQAEEGMTWAEWVASSYNTGGFAIDSSGKYIVDSSNKRYLSTLNHTELVGEIITANESYSMSYVVEKD